jgi:hypothetical protein
MHAPSELQITEDLRILAILSDLQIPLLKALKGKYQHRQYFLHFHNVIKTIAAVQTSKIRLPHFGMP